jgi:hypothetical protein
LDGGRLIYPLLLSEFSLIFLYGNIIYSSYVIASPSYSSESLNSRSSTSMIDSFSFLVSWEQDLKVDSMKSRK